jgi:hypothetical protein
MKETREILDNILQMKKSEYELLESSTASITSKPSDHKRHDRTNVLSSEADSTLHDEGTMDKMETYEPTQELDFEVDEVKECLEKKKKRRNYIEFRPDYEKCRD